MAETYDVIVTVPENKTYEFRASAEDGTGYAVTHIGHGDLLPASTYPKPNLVLMDMMGGMGHGSMGGHDMSNMKMPMTGNNAMDMPGMPKMDHSAHNKVPNQEKPTSNKQTLQPKTEVKMNDKMQDHSMHQGMDMSASATANKDTKAVKAKSPQREMSDMGSMDHSSMKSMKDSGHDVMKMKGESLTKNDKQLPHVDYLNNYKPVKSPNKTTLPKNQPIRIVTLKLTGSMERYVWTINDTPMYAADEIVIKKGENVKFILVNETMMNHPIHLHGHFFRVLNGQGEYSPLKHTEPSAQVIIYDV